MTDYLIHALPIDVLTHVRGAGPDPSIERRTSNAGGEPLRCCLRDAAEGEELILFNYEPRLPASPYREVGPVFAHASGCAGPDSTTMYPAGWLGRPQVLRAYDRRGWIHDAVMHDGTDPEPVIARFLDNPEVERVHSRNVAYGCYMFTITRP
jgi:hypothetical protein